MYTYNWFSVKSIISSLSYLFRTNATCLLLLPQMYWDLAIEDHTPLNLLKSGSSGQKPTHFLATAERTISMIWWRHARCKTFLPNIFCNRIQAPGRLNHVNIKMDVTELSLKIIKKKQFHLKIVKKNIEKTYQKFSGERFSLGDRGCRNFFQFFLQWIW